MEEPSWDRYLEYLKNARAPQEDLDHFNKIDWVRPLLDKSGQYRHIPFFPRIEKGGTHDRFFNKVIKTPDTVPYALALTRQGDDWKRRLADVANNKAPKEGEPADFILVADLRSDLSGFADIAHGGLLAALFDDSMGSCVEMFHQSLAPEGEALFTANLNVSYRGPVELPCIIRLHVWVLRREGRKWWVKGKLMTGEDGVVTNEAESLWISPKPKENL